MGVVLKNNAEGVLAVAISSGTTTLTLRPGEGNLFPEVGPGDWFPLTLVRPDGQWEILRGVARQGDNISVWRGQEGTSPLAFSAGDRVELRATADTLAELSAKSIKGLHVSGGEVQSVGVNSYRQIQGNYGTFWHQNGANLYLMLTSSGDPYGGFNHLRPFSVNLSDGRVSMENGLTTHQRMMAHGGLTVDNGIHSSGWITVGENAHFSPDGNIHGNVWGGWLGDYLVRSFAPRNINAGDVGSYCIGMVKGAIRRIEHNELVAGSDLVATMKSLSDGVQFPGTWKNLLGNFLTVGTGSAGSIRVSEFSLFLRVA